MSRDPVHGDWLFLEQNPDWRGPEEQEEKESSKWAGYDSGFEVLPHLSLDWKKLKEVAESSGKPIADLGASYSSLAAEGVLRGIEIIPVDSAYDKKTREYYPIAVYEHLANTKRYHRAYEEAGYGYGAWQEERWCSKARISGEDLGRAIKVAQGKLVTATADKLPFKDRALSMAIAHDSVPKYSPNLDTFLQKQLPEILRVTDKIVLIYPMAIYKPTTKTFTPEGGDLEAARKDESVAREVLEETHALYKDSAAIQKITEAAERLGFTFTLEVGGKLKDTPDNDLFMDGARDAEPMLGVFTRRT